MHDKHQEKIISSSQYLDFLMNCLSIHILHLGCV